MLQDAGSNLDLAFSIEKALVSVRLHRLIMSIHGQKTISVAEELANRSVLFLLVTGYATGDGDPPMVKAAPRLKKPFNEDDLAQRMAEVFRP
jgi:hypothetical protein